ncbi:MAG TPA: phytanoyl-CoA dioxygenase family protein [Planctomycetota bacterium]|nr:phytanoyl-CoA dioxygenase family protein [Planctomycetota bacterium]
MTSTIQADPATATLSVEQVKAFHDNGYHILPGFLPDDLNRRLKAEIDQFVEDHRAKPIDPYAKQQQAPRKMQLEYHEHGFLLTEPRLMAILGQLMGGAEFSLHHLHTARHDAGCGGVCWHHDYEQIPQTNRSHLMVHVFFYLNGLDGTIGDLMILPGSHHKVMERDGMAAFATADLPGAKVIDDVPPGTAIIVHSAMMHARRAKPGGVGRPRYFIDSSYCQAGVQWPSFGREHLEHMMTRAKALGLGRGGRYDFVFDPARFYPADEGRDRLEAVNTGSLVQRL